jgi:hypothetical protein
MKQIYILLTFSLLTNPIFAQNTLEKEQTQAFSIGEILRMNSDVLQEERILNIYLPQSYAQDSLRKYPVIYLLDGSAEEDFIHIAGLVQFGSFSWINMLPESIVVGVANVDRKRDFTYPSKNKQDNTELPSSGGSAAFIQFIQTELQPLMEQRYRTSANKTLIGQSLGGLLATEILFKQPDAFDHYFIVSPSLWWDDAALLDFDPVKYTSKKSIFIAVGKEGPTMEKAAKALFDKLDALKTDQTRLFYQYFPKLDHGDTLHQAIYDGFEKVFGSK